jgi:hypothetical protein
MSLITNVITARHRQTTASLVNVLIFSGSVILFTRTHEWAEFSLTIAALVFEGAAICLTLMCRLWQRSHRYLIYPMVLICTIYVWDKSLPPPNLPDGLLRAAMPFCILGLLYLDSIYSLIGTGRRKRRIIDGRVRRDQAEILEALHYQ